jgi:hypothetical protein
MAKLFQRRSGKQWLYAIMVFHTYFKPVGGYHSFKPNISSPHHPTSQSNIFLYMQHRAVFFDHFDLHMLRSSYVGGEARHRKFETNIPRSETARPPSQCLHSCICERFIYAHDLSAYFAVLCLRTDRGNI